MKQKRLIIVLFALPLGLQAAESLPTITVEADIHVEASEKTEALAQEAAGQTLGDYLDALPNVDSASYGAAVGRPVIKGMAGYRVNILQNDTEASDLSAMSQDHAVGVNAKAAERIELLKGPASLLYGAHAGGAVRVVDHLAEAFPKSGLSGQLEASMSSNNQAQNLSGQISAAGDKLALSVSGVKQQTQNYYDGQGNETQDSDVLSEQGQIGLTYRYDSNAQLQLYTTQLHKDYGIPNVTDQATRIEMWREDYGLKWTGYELTPNLDQLQLGLQTSDYLHDETEGGRRDGLFGQKQQSATLSADYAVGDWFGTAKLGFESKALKVCHIHGDCDDFTLAERTGKPLGESLANYMTSRGLPYSHGHPMPDSESQVWHVALQGEKTVVNEAVFSLASYIEVRSLTVSSANIQETWVYPAHLDGDYYDFKPDWASSISLGWNQPIDNRSDWTLNVSYLQRLPSVDELYWNGFHHATDSYIFGNRDLKKEQSLNLDWDLHWQTGQGDWLANVFYYRFKDYIYQQTAYDEQGDKLIDPFHLSDVWMTHQANAHFYGGSVAYAHRLLDWQGVPVVFSNQLDLLYAKLADGRTLPRTSPMTWLAGLSYEPIHWSAKLHLKQVFKTTELAQNETATDGYQWLSFYTDWQPKSDTGQWKLWLKGENLLNQPASNHLSFLKETAPLMGRQVSFGVSWQYR